MAKEAEKIDFKKVAEKWQDKWEKEGVFEANPDEREKFFCNFPYPYINAYQHIGHLFTLMRVEAFARYKRLQGFNVLFPQGWHATGSPIVQAAKRVKEREPKQVAIMKDMGFEEKDLSKFENPEYWIEFFAPEFKSDYKSIGASIDWRREFHTTSLNPRYDKFIRWQFRKLKEKGLVVEGEFPVVWDPKEEVPVGDHDRVEGEGEAPQEFILVKHKLEEGKYLVSATLRQDTILGITNLYVHPEVEYLEVEIDGEEWVLGEAAVRRLEEQGRELDIKGKVVGIDLIGKKTEEVDGHEVLVLPATFIDPEFGTGLVHSVPSDSADDLIALWDLQKDEERIEKYGLDVEEVKAIEPIPVLNTPGYSDVPAKDMLEKYGVESQDERAKLEKIKKELYKLSFHSATFNEKYKDVFSKDISGEKVADYKDFVKEELLETGWIDTYYQLTGKVVSRSLTECIVKIVDDQWFIDYANTDWKKQAKKCLDDIKLYPEKARSQFEYVIGWLHEWACTREAGLGTRLPWDEKWLIESLSDSTIYMAYYTINHILENVAVEDIDDNLFDYVLLGKDVDVKCGKGIADRMREEFEYWYPVDFRNSGKDLIQNHLTFFIFNHTAIFPEKHWPKGIGANGWVTVDGQKMSKSLGNVIPVRKMVEEFGPDASRLTILAGGEQLDDPNWDSALAESLPSKFRQIIEMCEKYHGKGRGDVNEADKWMESKLNRIIQDATNAMDETLFRTAIQKIFFDLGKTIRSYVNKGKPNKEVITKALEAQLVMLTPFIPHVCEEAWERIGGDGFISVADWPAVEEDKIDDEAEAAEEMVSGLRGDINQVLNLAGIKSPEKITLYVADAWKYEFVRVLKEEMEDSRNPGEILKNVMKTDLKKHGQDISKMVPALVKDPTKMPEVVLGQKKELEKLSSERKILEEEFDCSFEVVKAEDSKDSKSKKAMPGKPGIVAE